MTNSFHALSSQETFDEDVVWSLWLGYCPMLVLGLNMCFQAIHMHIFPLDFEAYVSS